MAELEEIVISREFGGSYLPEKVENLLKEWKNEYIWGEDGWIEHMKVGRDIPRDDPDLIRAIKQLGRIDVCSDCWILETDGQVSLAIVKIPGDIEWYVADYDGQEWIAEIHRTWGEDI